MKQVKFKELEIGDRFKENSPCRAFLKKTKNNDNENNAKLHEGSDLEFWYDNEELVWKIED